MNLSTSEEGEKSWDHPWSTDEMRLNQHEWSLAGDVGLLRHLEKFSQTLTSRVKSTQENLDSLTNDLNETTVLIDNVTNASLALANTQFIESRVYEDDPSSEDQRRKKTESVDVQKELTEAEMIAVVSENIKRGLQIMDDKYDRVEVVASDDSDDDNPTQSMVSVPSFILRPKDPYKDRPLPYVIGSDKWQASSKIGIESSSSESEAQDNDDDDDDDESTEGDKITHIFNSTQRNNLLAKRPSLSSSESSDFNDKSNYTNKLASGPSSTTDKMYTRSQDTLNSTSEIDTPIEVRGKSSGRDAPGFAEELAKRLGSVLPAAKADNSKADRSSINRSNDDLFDNEEKNEEDIFNVKKDNLFRDGGLFDDDVPNSLWNNKPLRRPQSNIIPASIDLPPPIHSVEAKPKSSIDDLFGEVDSDDSDDIFAPRSSTKSTVFDRANVGDNPKNESVSVNRFTGIDQTSAEKVATSTPEINTSVPNLFDDDEDDSLFNYVKNSVPVRSPETIQSLPRGRVPGVLISKADLLSSSLGSKIFQRARQDSSESSETEETVGVKGEGDRNVSAVTAGNVSRSSSLSSKSNATQSRENDKSASTSNASSTIAGNRIHVSRESSDSSGISIPPQSISSNLSTSLGLERPQMESTRLISEELSRERLTSDSLLNQRSRQQGEEANSGRDVSTPVSGAVQEHLTSNSNSKSNTSTTSKEVNIFDDDVFSPPPLPKNDIKSKSKVISLFDDSDSGDDLFSNTSSGSRSHKSADVLANSNNNNNLMQKQELVKEAKSKINQPKLKNNLFDDDNDKIEDIFGTTDDSDIDIFLRQKSKSNIAVSSDLSANKVSEEIKIADKKLPSSGSGSGPVSFITNKSNVGRKTLSIFDDSDEEDDDLFSTNTKITKKPSNMFYGGGGRSGGGKSDDADDLFAKPTSTENKLKEKEEEEEEAVEEAARPKKDSAEAVTFVEGEKKSKVKLDEKQNNSDQVLPSVDVTHVNLHSQSQRLFDDYKGEDSDDEDSLFGKASVKSTVKSGKLAFDIVYDSVVNIKETKITTVQIASEDNSDTEINSVSATDGGKMSRINDNDTASIVRIPPKSLKIKLPAVTVDDDNESVSPPRRAVSGKIKNLMGKMGDLKILSPTDTPLTWRKAAGDKPDSENDNTPDRDSEDGSSISVPSTKSPTVLFDENIYTNMSLSPSIETETAVSFDVPAQAETLTIKGSKILQNRARIPVKRRPQSRQARQTALRTSGLDFDTADTAGSGAFDSNDLSSSVAKTKAERPITRSTTDNSRDEGVVKNKHYLNLTTDDRSEMSLSKDGSISTTKNTLLSPSTDEEDLFDVPPDLPEDPPKDSLFDQAPILSPVQARKSKSHFGNSNDNDKLQSSYSVNKSKVEREEKSGKSKKKYKESTTEKSGPLDPLRDDNHDPLKDPSQLFAFVTKTPSPEKGQSLLFDEDDSLFSITKKEASSTCAGESTKKSPLDLFDDDSTSDLFSGPFTKPVKKPVKGGGVKSSLFNDFDSEDDDETDDLFASVSSRKSNQSKSELSDTETSAVGDNAPKQGDGFEDDEDNEEELFFDASEKPSSDSSKGDDQSPAVITAAAAVVNKKTKLEDIFGDHSSGEDDIFFTKKPIAKGKAGSFFSNEAESDDDLFAIKPASSGNNSQCTENQVPVKKSITRDLKKTAETIVEDPLSILHND